MRRRWPIVVAATLVAAAVCRSREVGQRPLASLRRDGAVEGVHAVQLPALVGAPQKVLDAAARLDRVAKDQHSIRWCAATRSDCDACCARCCWAPRPKASQTSVCAGRSATRSGPTTLMRRRRRSKATSRWPRAARGRSTSRAIAEVVAASPSSGRTRPPACRCRASWPGRSACWRRASRAPPTRGSPRAG